MLQNMLLGKLSLEAIPFHDPIIMGTAAFMGLIFAVVLGAITYYQKWTWLWREWITSVDHKKIGIMYIILAFSHVVARFIDALMMRLSKQWQ